ncbi:OadG-related small transporter subunit [Clostridium tunisiense]|nr:OadG-related small transporter subunit [Clostridium tunisiense]
MSNIDVFLETLPVMGKGMAGIFVVMFIIFLSIKLLNSTFKVEKEK